MPLKPGSNKSPSDFENSMAAAMEVAFKEEWNHVMKGAEEPKDLEQMRMLFAAIAKGVVRHLHANPGAFKVTVSNSIETLNGEVITIEKTDS